MGANSRRSRSERVARTRNPRRARASTRQNRGEIVDTQRSASDQRRDGVSDSGEERRGIDADPHHQHRSGAKATDSRRFMSRSERFSSCWSGSRTRAGPARACRPRRGRFPSRQHGGDAVGAERADEMRNSPTKPLSPGNPIEAKVARRNAPYRRASPRETAVVLDQPAVPSVVDHADEHEQRSGREAVIDHLNERPCVDVTVPATSRA